jgi:hypothetical protein
LKAAARAVLASLAVVSLGLAAVCDLAADACVYAAAFFLTLWGD